MSEKVGGVYIEIQAKMGSLEADLRKLEARLKQTDNAASDVSSTFSGMGKFLAAGVIAGGLASIGKAALSASAAMESNKIAFTTMLGSAEKANQLLADMTEFAAKTPFDLPGIVDAGKRMLAFGFAADEIIPKLRQLGDVSAALNQPIGDIVYLFGQIKTTGRAMTMDLNQFANRGIPIFEEVGKVMGRPKEEVKKLAEESKVTYKVIEKAFENMTASGSKFGGLMEAQSQSLGGKWSNFKDTLGKTAVIIGDDLSPVAKDLLDIATSLISKISSKDMPDSITMTGSIIKDVNALLNGTKDHIDQIVLAMGDTEADALYQNVVNTERTADGVAGHFEEILGYFDKTTGQYENLNGAAAMYTAYTSGDIRLKQEQIAKLEKLLSVGQQMTKEAQVVNAVGLTLGTGYAEAIQKAYDASKKGNAETGKSEVDKKWQSAAKAAKDLADSINKDYVGALGNVDQKLDLEKEKFSKQADEVIKNYERRLISEESYLKQIDQLQAEYEAVERKRFDEKLKDFQDKYNQYTGVAKDLSGQLSSVISMAASNQTTNIDNTLKKKLDAIDEEYEANVEAVNNSVLTEEEKAAKLKALDEQKEREKEALENAAEKKKRKIQREAAKKQKLISMFETIISTPDAAMKSYLALAGIPIVGPALGMAAAAAATALGIAKLKLIQETPLPALAMGGIVPAVPGGTPVRVSEAGSAEAVIPLNSQFGLDMLSQALAKAGGNSGGITHITLNIDGDKLYENIYQASRSGRVKIASGAMVA